MKSVDLIGWASSFILLLTIGRQVHTQSKTGATGGVSKWLFIGQFAASTGYVVYSYLLHNWVFLCSNLALLITAIIGEALYAHNRRHHGSETRAGSRAAPSRNLSP